MPFDSVTKALNPSAALALARTAKSDFIFPLFRSHARTTPPTSSPRMNAAHAHMSPGPWRDCAAVTEQAPQTARCSRLSALARRHRCTPRVMPAQAARSIAIFVIVGRGRVCGVQTGDWRVLDPPVRSRPVRTRASPNSAQRLNFTWHREGRCGGTRARVWRDLEMARKSASQTGPLRAAQGRHSVRDDPPHPDVRDRLGEKRRIALCLQIRAPSDTGVWVSRKAHLVCMSTTLAAVQNAHRTRRPHAISPYRRAQRGSRAHTLPQRRRTSPGSAWGANVDMATRGRQPSSPGPRSRKPTSHHGPPELRPIRRVVVQNVPRRRGSDPAGLQPELGAHNCTTTTAANRGQGHLGPDQQGDSTSSTPGHVRSRAARLSGRRRSEGGRRVGNPRPVAATISRRGDHRSETRPPRT